MTTTVRLGDRRMSYRMNPLDTRGREIHGGNNYANADTIEGAREYAARVIGTSPYWAGTFIEGVSIYGRMMEFTGECWREVRGEDARSAYEVIRHPEQAPLTPADEREHCYATTVMDRYEVVHPRRSNGTCSCGHHGRWQW